MSVLQPRPHAGTTEENAQSGQLLRPAEDTTTNDTQQMQQSGRHRQLVVNQPLLQKGEDQGQVGITEGRVNGHQLGECQQGRAAQVHMRPQQRPAANKPPSLGLVQRGQNCNSYNGCGIVNHVAFRDGTYSTIHHSR